MNLTVSVPEGSTTHGNSDLLCTPPAWTDFVIFYFGNYFAHVATIIAAPGQGIGETLFVLLFALLFPGSGVRRAIDVIKWHPRTEKDSLKRAIRAGAVAMVVKRRSAIGNNEKAGTPVSPAFGTDRDLEKTATSTQGSNPEITGDASTSNPESNNNNAATDTIEEVPIAKPQTSVLESKHDGSWWDLSNSPRQYDLLPPGALIHGQYTLPAEYQFVFVPRHISLLAEAPEEAENNLLAATFNVSKLVISIVQAIWAIITLYRARGDQIQKYGYAAFGLTVAPYAYMSLLNLVATLLNTEYPAIFLLRTPVMGEAERAGGYFASELKFKASTKSTSIPENVLHDDRSSLKGNKVSLIPLLKVLFDVRSPTPTVLLAFFFACVPLALVGGLSEFYAGTSTTVQRVFTLTWLGLGITVGVAVDLRALITDIYQNRRKPALYLRNILVLIYGAAAVGGMVVVGLMIRDYGTCTRLG